MKKNIIFTIFIISFILNKNSIFAIDPDFAQDIPLIQFEFYDRENHNIIYDSIPMIAKSSNNGTLSIQPSISLDSMSGESKLQFWLSYFPVFDILGKPKLIEPNYLTITSLKRSIKFPILFKQFTPPITGVAKAGTISDAQETGYIYVFPEDVHKLKLLILDTIDSPINNWDPQMAEQRFNTLENNKIIYTPSIYKQKQLHSYRENQHKLSFGRYGDSNIIIRPIVYKGTPHDSPLLIQQKKITFTLYGNNKTVSWNVTPDIFWILFESIEYYENINSSLLP